MNDAIAGHVPLAVGSVFLSKPHIDSKRLRALAVTTSQRSANLPDVPTVAESGLPGHDELDRDFTGAILADCDLSGARLDNANLFGADMQNARMVDASLRRADLPPWVAVLGDANRHTDWQMRPADEGLASLPAVQAPGR